MSAVVATVAAAPRTASQRAYLRDGMPTIYREPGSFAMRFVGGLEEVLDPIVALLDSLYAHIDPDLAPPALVDAMASWLGLRIDPTVDPSARRLLVRGAIERAPQIRDALGRLEARTAKSGVIRQRGTRAGLELVLRLSFPDAALTVHDDGVTAIDLDPRERPPASPRTFVVRAGIALDEQLRAAIDRVVREMQPVGTSFRVEDPPAAARPEADTR